MIFLALFGIKLKLKLVDRRMARRGGGNGGGALSMIRKETADGGGGDSQVVTDTKASQKPIAISRLEMTEIIKNRGGKEKVR